MPDSRVSDVKIMQNPVIHLVWSELVDKVMHVYKQIGEVLNFLVPLYTKLGL